MSNIDKQARDKLKAAAAKAVDNLDPNMFVETRDVLALLDELETADALNKHLELAIRKAEGCSEKLRKKAEAAEERVAELEAREVKLPQRYSMLHRTDFDEPYQAEMVYKQHQVLEALHDAGIRINGEV